MRLTDLRGRLGRRLGGRLKTRRNAVALVVIPVTLIIGSVAVFGMLRLGKRSPTQPTFEVKQSEFLDNLQFRGEVKALKSVTLSAPADAGDLQILKLAANGATVKQGDVVVEFDRSKTEQDRNQDQSALKSAQADTEQARAQARLTEEQDITAVMKAKYDLEVARLEASKQEIVSRIDGAEATLKSSDAQQKLHEAEEKLRSDRAVNGATLDTKTEAGKKAAYDVDRAQHALGSMLLHAPSNGVVSLISVWHAGNEQPFKAGERAWPGTPIVELPDASSLFVSARVDETERGRLALQQPVTIQLDAIPERQFTGRLQRIGTIASSDFSGGWPFPRNFKLDISFDQRDARLNPGMTAQITVLVDRVPDALTIPLQASFQKQGHTVAYVWNGSKFEERVLQVGRRSRDRILVANGLRSGDRVALKDPALAE